jgi:hypothetical protein
MGNCICGMTNIELVSYFNKETGLRITVCEKCADRNNFNNKKKYDSIPYTKITEQQNKTPEPNAS